MEARLAAVAKGSQPAVVKMASYGGGARVGAMLNYVSRGGELKVENESGRILEGREELSRIRGDWDHLFQNRAESRDIGSFSVEIAASGFASDEALHEQVRSTLTSGFGDRRYAYAIAKNDYGSVTVQGLVVLRSGQGERLTGDAKAAGIIQGRYDASAAAGKAAAKFSFHGYGNGVEFGASRLRGLVDRHEDVRDDRGQHHEHQPGGRTPRPERSESPAPSGSRPPADPRIPSPVAIHGGSSPLHQAPLGFGGVARAPG